jgi:hypothetical protein
MRPLKELTDADLERLMVDGRGLLDAPEHVIQRGLAVWKSSRPAAPGVLERLAAVLTFDSAGASALAFGARSNAAGVRQMFYSVEGREIDLRIAGVDDRAMFKLSGQVLGPDTAGSVMVMPSGGAGDIQSCPLSDLGEFVLAPLGPGRYHLRFELGGTVIDLPMLGLPLEA